MWPALLARFWKPLALIGAVLVLWALMLRLEAKSYQRGYQQATSENAKALAERDAENARKEAADEKRIADAYRAKELALGQLAALRAQPPRRVLCHASDPGPVPSPAGLSAADAARDGPLQASGGREFDPTERLYKAADEADDIVEACRALNSAVHGG